MADGSNEQAAARAAVMECEQEIQSIKAALRQLSAVDSGEPNSLEIVLLKVEGLPEGAQPKLILQLSSPVEEASLTEIFDPNNVDAAPEGSLAVFKAVETAVATLTVSAADADISLGSSAPHDLGPLCTINAMDIKEKYETDLPVAIVSGDQQVEGKVQAGEVIGDTKGEEAADNEEKGTAVAKIVQPICTLTLRVTYKPSPKDRREELYEILNKTSQRKANALENLRKISMKMAEKSPSTKASAQNALTKPSIKPGFLNQKKKEPTKMEKLYQRTLGPNSILRKGLGLLIFAKDYVIFIGAVSFFHFRGQVLALPAPV